MTSGVVFGLSVLMNFVACGIVTKLCIWPRLRVMSREEALLPLVAPHMFRFVGLSFLVPGVVFHLVVARFRAPGRLWRPRRGAARDHHGPRARRPRFLGASHRMDIQSVGHDRSVVCDLSRRDWRPHRSGLARCGVLYTDRRGAPASRDTWADILASAAATTVAAASAVGAPSPRRNEGSIFFPSYGQKIPGSSSSTGMAWFSGPGPTEPPRYRRRRSPA